MQPIHDTATLAAEHEAMLQFLYLVPTGLVQCGADGSIQLVNPACAQLLMPLVPDGQLLNLFDALADLVPDLAHRVAAFTPTHGMVCQDLQLPVHGAGGARLQVLSLTLLKLEPERLMAMLSDITETVERDRALRHSQAWLHSLCSSIRSYALMRLDGCGRIVDWNAGIARLTRHDAASLLGRTMAVFLPEGQLPPARLRDRLAEADADGWTLDEGWCLRADGSRFWASMMVTPLAAPGAPGLPGQPADAPADDPAAPAYSLVLRDISGLRETHETLRRSVLSDHLTGLANRRAFFEAAELELQRWQRAPRPMALVAIDADHFKQVNDRHGHAAGDAVLRHLAAGLGASCRALDLVARVGGEEFMVLLPGTDADGALAMAQRLCDAIARQPVVVDGVPIPCTVSAGVAAMEPGVQGLQGWMKRADQALYRAKTEGRNCARSWTAALDPAVPAEAPAPALAEGR